MENSTHPSISTNLSRRGFVGALAGSAGLAAAATVTAGPTAFASGPAAMFPQLSGLHGAGGHMQGTLEHVAVIGPTDWKFGYDDGIDTLLRDLDGTRKTAAAHLDYTLWGRAQLPRGARVTGARLVSEVAHALPGFDDVKARVLVHNGINVTDELGTMTLTTAAPAVANDAGRALKGVELTADREILENEIVLVEVTGGSELGHSTQCVEIYYTAPPIFVPTPPVRVFDSRVSAWGSAATLFAPNSSREIDITDTRETDGTLVVTDFFPGETAAIAFNVTVAGTTGPNFLAVQSSSSTKLESSTINWTASGIQLANGSSVAINGDRKVKVFMGPGSGSTHVIIDVTGYWV